MSYNLQFSPLCIQKMKKKFHRRKQISEHEKLCLSKFLLSLPFFLIVWWGFIFIFIFISDFHKNEVSGHWPEKKPCWLGLLSSEKESGNFPRVISFFRYTTALALLCWETVAKKRHRTKSVAKQIPGIFLIFIGLKVKVTSSFSKAQLILKNDTKIL